MALSSEAPSGILLASAARTADAYSAAQTNDAGYKGVFLIVKTSAEVGACTLTPTVEAWNPAEGEWVTLSSAAAINTETTTQILVHPVGTDVVAVTIVAPLPHTWRLFMDIATAGSTGFTYSVGYQYIR